MSPEQTNHANLYPGLEARYDYQGQDADPEEETAPTIVRTFSGLLYVLADVTA